MLGEGSLVKTVDGEDHSAGSQNPHKCQVGKVVHLGGWRQTVTRPLARLTLSMSSGLTERDLCLINKVEDG